MPLLGKRKYINEKITELIKKLDELGYDTRRIKSIFYETEYEEENEVEGETGENNSAGSILPYRKKINDVLNMIDNIINKNESNNHSNNYSNNYNTSNNYELSNQFKNNLLREVNKQNLMNNNEDVQQNTFSLF